MLILVTNKSTLCTDDQVQKMTLALEIWLCTLVAPCHDRIPPTVRYAAPAEADPPADEATLRIFIVDAPPAGQDANVLGYHTEGPNGALYSFVFAKPVLDAGGGVLDRGTANSSVAGVVGHEGGEGLIDPNVNRWVDGPARKEGSCYPEEICDPVEETLFAVTLPDGTEVWMPAFVTKAWFDQLAPVALARSVPDLGIGSFEIAPGGYCVVRSTPGTETEIFAERKPAEWKMAMKAANPGSRTKKRKEQGVAAAMALAEANA